MLVSRSNEVSGCYKHKGCGANRSVCNTYPSRYRFNRAGQSFRNDGTLWDTSRSSHARFNSLCSKPNRGYYSDRDVFPIGKWNNQHGRFDSDDIHFLDSICVNSLTKSSEFLIEDMKYLVIGPGAMAFYAMLGAVYGLAVDNKTDGVEAISGSSAGAIVAFGILVAKWDVKRLYREIEIFDIASLMRYDIKSLIKNYGLVPIERWKLLFSKICKRLTDRDDFTFEELYEWSGSDLYISSYNLTQQKRVYFSRHTDPTMSVIDAVCTSICIPFIIESAIYKGDRYIDLASFETTPSLPFIDKTDVVSIELDAEPDKRTKSINSLLDFVNSFASSVMKNRVFYDKPTIYITMKEGSAFNFNLNKEEKNELFMKGFRAARNFITN